MVWISNKEDRKRDRAHVSITSSLVQCHAPGLVAITNLKPRKLILKAFSDWTRKLPAIRYFQVQPVVTKYALIIVEDFVN